MKWTGLLQNLLLLVHLRQILCASLRFSVPEEQEAGTLAGTLAEYFPPPYLLLSQEYLWMDKNTGNFYITEQRMDREALCPEDTKAEECIMLLNALVGPAGDIIQFPVIVEDINDNAPHFENSQIHLRVPEDVTMGTSFLLDDLARDSDVGRNADLRYRLEGSDGAFELKVESGPVVSLVVQAALDRESQDRYWMELVASDGGEDPLSATATVVVTVTDVNDNCPRFTSEGPQSVTIPRGSAKDTVVAQVSATDPDLGSNAAIEYALSSKVSSRARALFSLDSRTGQIRLKQDLKGDRGEELQLKVFANGNHCPPAETQVTVSVLPATNRAPAIKIGFIADHQNQTMALPENQPPTGLAVLQLQGDSHTEGTSLCIDSDEPFILSRQGEKYLLSTSKPLDYETKSEYQFYVAAKRQSADGPPITSARLLIRVLVQDVNDNAPRFLQAHYAVEVRENNQAGEPLLQVSAFDMDPGDNGRVSYSLGEHVSSIFELDRTTGLLSVSAALDREQQAVHRFTVLARDAGSPPLESVATVSVRVLDQNDNAPVFVNRHFVFFVPEDVPPFTPVGRIGVTDPDEGQNGEVGLSLVNSSASFVVDNSKGTLRSTTSLDREVQDHYELYLLASDNGHPFALTSTSRVTIFVEDVNDNQPQVILPDSNRSCLIVSPATATGTMITKVQATDADSGPNSEITYKVAAHEPRRHGSPFRVDSRSGNITVSQRLKQEHIGMHHLFVVVSDGGKPAPLHTTVWVNLLVNETVEPCHLDRAPRSLPYSLAQTPSEAPICEVEEGSTRSAQLTLLAGLGMLLASICLFVLTAVFHLKQRRRRPEQTKSGVGEENEIPLREKYYSD